MTKSQLIKSMLLGGKTPKEISHSLNVPVGSVYTARWQMKKEGKRRKVGRPKKIVQTLKFKNSQPPAPKYTPLANFVLQEMVNIEHQIDRLNTIRSFLSIRLQQLEQNGE